MWIVLLAAFAGVLLAPPMSVMAVARVLRARRAGFWPCLGATFLSTMLLTVAVLRFQEAGLVVILVSAFGYMAILDTSYVRGLAITAMQLIVQVLVAVLLFYTPLGMWLHLT